MRIPQKINSRNIKQGDVLWLSMRKLCKRPRDKDEPDHADENTYGIE